MIYTGCRLLVLLALFSLAACFQSPTLISQNKIVARSHSGVRSLKAAVSPPKVDDKEEVREYFNTNGFERWNAIYSDSDSVNKVQLDIRVGHQQTVDKVLGWLDADGVDKTVKGKSFVDAGCGVGLLTLPLASRGAKVFASDISAAMTKEAAARAKEALGRQANNCKFETADLESLKGSYDNVLCIDVMIHYPTDKMYDMVQHLASLAKDRVIVSFAPNTWYYSLLKKVGELFPGPSKTTRAYLHKEEAVRKALKDAGFTIKRTEMTGTNFYFSRLLEAVRE
uniref:Magnesium-protoporphyrin IX methyltransferase C-terminal domain-containing protein n=1 Tax=Fibrocapsa japonica TaxID=94617 RepID=A0A7S2V2R3_9STRA|mmetsp:Transcript_455/g.671  ORF Transcript_455/g.671 Transcript_455/m.671 type:complete len:282 (+) Transcript_455:102-947(+)|eukprot:CAMPEP_0113942300 /NCGR_PEP_ID=MMETSP1339-20121228/8032_1 /TAXON_ID=94617 /ORGANISM="Fibrocapsa japonica" /LENGTH=281 /DNA_ID=CAMNT_0000946709 /DNA_START=100 /DNA_END=945 /DNA_ORIENTATION=+ /assembly_acc=CAM_ASM_000762